MGDQVSKKRPNKPKIRQPRVQPVAIPQQPVEPSEPALDNDRPRQIYTGYCLDIPDRLRQNVTITPDE